MISPNLKILNRIKAITVLPFVFLLSYQNTYSQVERIKKKTMRWEDMKPEPNFS